jgi:pimeloyl-ACP methyl ester carboxylesterase
VAREMVRLAPECVQALVLVATSARGVSPRDGAAAQADRTAFSGLSRRSIETALHPDHAGEATVERIRSMGARLGVDAFLRQFTMQLSGDVDRLAEIRCPTLVVAASADRVRTTDEVRELYKGIPNPEFSLIEGSGHMIRIEAPQAFATTVLEWLGRRGFGRSIE